MYVIFSWQTIMSQNMKQTTLPLLQWPLFITSWYQFHQYIQFLSFKFKWASLMKIWAFKMHHFVVILFATETEVTKYAARSMLLPMPWYVEFELHSRRIYDVVSSFLASLNFKATLYSTSSWINTWSWSNFRTTIPNYVFSHCTDSPLLATRKYDSGRIFTLM